MSSFGNWQGWASRSPHKRAPPADSPKHGSEYTAPGLFGGCMHTQISNQDRSFPIIIIVKFPHLTGRSENCGCLPSLPPCNHHNTTNAPGCLALQEGRRNDLFENQKKKQTLGRVSCLFVYAAWGINRRRKALRNALLKSPDARAKLR
jgi:hypothetical protein